MGKNGVGIANGAKLIMLSEAQTYVCGAEEPITSGSDTFYHCGNDQAIIVPAESTNDMHDMGVFKEDVKAGIRHEFGHVVQSGIPSTSQKAVAENEELRSELQATCYAGALTITIDAESVAEIRERFQRARTSDEHGTGAQQAAAYDQGVERVAAKGPIEACASVPVS